MGRTVGRTVVGKGVVGTGVGDSDGTDVTGILIGWTLLVDWGAINNFEP